MGFFVFVKAGFSGCYFSVSSYMNFSYLQIVYAEEKNLIWLLKNLSSDLSWF